MQSSSAKIFNSGPPGFMTSVQVKRNYLFNNHFPESRNGFGSLYLFNEEELCTNASLTMAIDDASFVIIIPITGNLNFKEQNCNCVKVNVGQLLITTLHAKSVFSIENPSANKKVSFLQVLIRGNSTFTNYCGLLDFELMDSLDRVVELTPYPGDALIKFPFRLSMREFCGMEESKYKIGNRHAGIFSFSLAGTFEIGERMLHPGDGLGLWNVQEIGLTALSNYARLLTIELDEEYIN